MSISHRLVDGFWHTLVYVWLLFAVVRKNTSSAHIRFEQLYLFSTAVTKYPASGFWITASSVGLLPDDMPRK